MLISVLHQTWAFWGTLPSMSHELRSASGRTAEPGAGLDELRVRVLERSLALSALAAPVVAAVAVAGVAAAGRLIPITFVCGAYSLLFPALWLGSRWLSHRTTAALFLVLVVGAAPIAHVRGG